MNHRESVTLATALMAFSLIVTLAVRSLSQETQGAKVAKSTSPPFQKESVHQISPYVKITPALKKDMMMYEDEWNGFRLEYPSFLHTDSGWIFRNSDDANEIALNVQFYSSDPKSYRDLRRYISSLSVSTEVINGVKWVRYSGNEGAGYCVYRNHQQVEISGAAERNNSQAHLSASELNAIHQMVTTFIFAPLSSRIDSKIAALKVGTKYGALRISRVITRQEAAGNRKRYHYDPAGEVQFSGSLTLTSAVIENQQTMNSGPYYVLSQVGTDDCEKLPHIGYTVDCTKRSYPDLVISLKNADFVAKQLQARPHRDDDELTIVVTDLSEVFYGRSSTQFSAKLVKIEWDE